MSSWLIRTISVLAVTVGGAALAQQMPQVRVVEQYSVKFVCGGSSEEYQEGVVRGVHATSISLHNPSAQRSVSYVKRASRALPFQRPDTLADPVVDTVGPLATVEVECDEIRMMLPSSMTAQFRSGVLAIDASGPLDVVAVYTSRPRDADVSTIDVEYIEPRVARGQPPTGSIDLTVTEIDLGTLVVTCPNGQGSCRASVEVTVANIGTADSPATDVLVTFDPNQSIDVEHEIGGGLPAGSSETFGVRAFTRGNCFDPDCTICAEIDPDDAIAESDEMNNRMCRVRAG